MVTYTDRPGLTGAFAGRRQFQLVDDPSLDNSVPDRSFLTGIHSFGYSNGGSFIPYNGNLFSCAVGVPAACLPSGVPRVFLFQPDGTLRESNYGTDFRPVGSGNNKGGDDSTLNDTGTLQPGYKRYIANFLAQYDVSDRSETHTSELQSLMRISYAVFCLKKKKTQLVYSRRTNIHYSINISIRLVS